MPFSYPLEPNKVQLSDNFMSYTPYFQTLGGKSCQNDHNNVSLSKNFRMIAFWNSPATLKTLE